MFGFRKRTKIPYHHDPKTPIWQIGRRDRVSLDECMRGTVILGGSGSGKTSGSARALAKAFLRAGMGGLVMCAHDEERRQWERLAKETGRQFSLISVDASGARRFNFLDYTMATLAADGFQTNLLDIIARIAQAGDVADGRGGGGGENKFFYDSAFEMLSNVFPVLQAVYGSLRLRDVMSFIDTAAQTPAQLKDAEWQRESFHAKTMALASLLVDQHPDLEVHGDYWIERFPRMADKTRSSVVATISSMLFPFLTGKLHEIFCTDTNIVPDLAGEGAIIILDIPVHIYGKSGATAQAIFKYLFQRAMEQREKHATEASVDFQKSRPVFLWADECQYFLSDQDTKFFSNARRYRTCGVYITQDMSSFYAALGSGAEHATDALLGKFQTRIWHANTDTKTNEAASELIGSMLKEQFTRSQNDGVSVNGGINQTEGDSSQSGGDGTSIGTSQSVSQYLARTVPPDYFTNKLRIGTKANRYLVDAVMLSSGRTWKHTGLNYVVASFDQRA